MANFNKVMLIGNVTRDLELRYLPSQTAVCDFSIATNRKWTGPDGIKKEEVTFVDCTVFGKQAEVLSKYRKKGDPLFIEGRLKLDQWEHEGQKRSKLKVVVENFEFLNRGQPGAYGGGAPGAAPGADAEYTGEDSASAPRPVAAPQARQQPFRPQQGRPGAQPARPAATPNYDVGDVPSVPEDEGVNIKGEDIPF